MHGEAFGSGTAAARALLELGLTGEASLTHKAGQFLGGVAFGDTDRLTEKQADWMGKLLERASLPPLGERVTQ